MRFDDGAHPGEIAIEHCQHLLRGTCLTHAGEVPQVGKENGDFAFFAARVTSLRKSSVGHCWRNNFAKQIANLIALGQAFAHVVKGAGEETDFIVGPQIDTME